MADLTIQPGNPLRLDPQPSAAKSEGVSDPKGSFGSVLNRSIETVNRIQQEADSRAAQLAAGESKDIHSTMIAMQKAEISMSLMMEVRNKLITAYDEIKRMQF
jgi:flagellar hook-basal body complex protein FliE